MTARLARLLAGLVLAAPLFCRGQDFVRLCERRLPKPVVRIERVDNGYSIDRRLSFAALTDIGANARRHGRQKVLGLTRAETASSIRVRLARLVDAASGRECASPEVAVTVGFQPLTVFIGREFPPDSCSYREILRHEMRHVEAYRSYLPQAEAAFRRRLAERFGGDLLYGRNGTLERGLKDEISRYWLPLLDGEIRKVEAVQAQIDSEEEYDRMEGACGGELQRLMRSRR